jgi:acyl-CoA reductase-like NAD-dependent aldehyde dehydrogenase
MSAATSLRTDFKLLIGGELVDGEESLDVINPATGAVFAHCPAAGKAQLDHAIATARHASVAWGRKSFEARAAAIKKMADVLRANQDSLAELLTREQGKPVSQSRDEIGRAATQSEGMAAIPIPVEKLVEDAERRIELHYRPLGDRQTRSNLMGTDRPGRSVPTCLCAGK